jgi:hypothetical protein
MRLFIPYFALFLCQVASFGCNPNPATRGYYWFALLNAASYLVLMIVVLYLNTGPHPMAYIRESLPKDILAQR